MKNFKAQLTRTNTLWTILLVLLFTCKVQGQTGTSLSGKIFSEGDSLLSFASVAIFSTPDSVLLKGTISDEQGEFYLSAIPEGTYYIEVRSIGYHPMQTGLTIATGQEEIDLGKLSLEPVKYKLKEAIVTAERIKARTQAGKTTFYVNSKLQKASSTGTDIVRLLPGIHVDLLHQISFEGSDKILFQINGIERDPSFLDQVNSDLIDKVEIIDHPGAEYDSDISAVVNVILKKKKNDGLSGHVYSEIPVNRNEVYAFPAASLTYSRKNIDLYSAYSGALSYFEIDNKHVREYGDVENVSELSIVQQLNQRNWSHRLSLGMDASLSENDQLGIYGYYNPYSNDHDGSVLQKFSQGDSIIDSRQFQREDLDKNRVAHAALHFKHQFPDPLRTLKVDADYERFSASNKTILINTENTDLLENTIEPNTYKVQLRLRYQYPILSDIIVNSGLSQKLETMVELSTPGFLYRENISSAHFSLSKRDSLLQLKGGFRVEYARIVNSESGISSGFSWLPHFNLKYQLHTNGNVQLKYSKVLQRPNVYQLTSGTRFEDPFTMLKGNPGLAPSLERKLNLDYSINFGSNFIQPGVFFRTRTNCIEQMVSLRDSFMVEKMYHNLGTIRKAGFKLAATFNLSKSILVNPFVSISNVRTEGNELAKNQFPADKSQVDLMAGLKMTATLPADIILSIMANFSTAKTYIQSEVFEDPLYFISVEKTIFDKVKVGITSAAPFLKDFTYYGYEVAGNGIRETHTENITLSMVPFWFKLKYSFSSGTKTNNKPIPMETSPSQHRKGF